MAWMWGWRFVALWMGYGCAGRCGFAMLSGRGAAGFGDRSSKDGTGDADGGFFVRFAVGAGGRRDVPGICVRRVKKRLRRRLAGVCGCLMMKESAGR